MLFFGIAIEFWALAISAIALVVHLLHLRPTAFVERQNCGAKSGYDVTVYNPKNQPIQIIDVYSKHYLNKSKGSNQLHEGFWVLPKNHKTISIVANAPIEGYLSCARLRIIVGGIITPATSYHLVLLHYVENE